MLHEMWDPNPHVSHSAVVARHCILRDIILTVQNASVRWRRTRRNLHNPASSGGLPLVSTVSPVSSLAPGSGDPGHQLITSSHQSWVLPSRNKQVYLHTIVAMRVPPSFQFSGIKNSQKRMSREKLENDQRRHIVFICSKCVFGAMQDEDLHWMLVLTRDVMTQT